MALSLIVGLLICGGPVRAQHDFNGGLTAVTVNPARLTPGQSFTVTVQGTVEPGKQCQLHYTVGRTGHGLLKDQYNDAVHSLPPAAGFPHTVSLPVAPSFPQAGDWKVTFWSGTTGPHPCAGNVSASVQVQSPEYPGRVPAEVERKPRVPDVGPQRKPQRIERVPETAPRKPRRPQDAPADRPGMHRMPQNEPDQSRRGPGPRAMPPGGFTVPARPVGVQTAPIALVGTRPEPVVLTTPAITLVGPGPQPAMPRIDPPRAIEEVPSHGPQTQQH